MRLLAGLGFAVLSLSATPTAQSTAPTVAVDVNGPHIILRTSEPRSWNDVTVDLNSYWTFTVPHLGQMKMLCINAVAFTVKPSIQAGKDFRGVHPDPPSMHVKTVLVRAANGAGITLTSVTEGMIKPLTKEEAALSCVGYIRP